MVVCRFFLQGRCIKGSTCNFEHPSSSIADTAPSVNTARAPVGPHTPEGQRVCQYFERGNCWFGAACKYPHNLLLSTPVPVDSRSSIPCVFFLRNACSKGASCPYSHDSTPSAAIAPQTSATSDAVVAASPQARPGSAAVGNEVDDAASSATSDLRSRTIGAAKVTFGSGVTVTEISLPSDFSTLTFTNIPADLAVEEFIEKLQLWSDYKADEVTWKGLDPRTQTRNAQAKIADRGEASMAAAATGHRSKLGETDIEIEVVHLGDSGSGINRLQLSGVTCTWYGPSRVAHFGYDSAEHATTALENAQKDSRMLLGRRPSFTRTEHPCWISVGNLDARTDMNELKRHFNGRLAPTKINMGPCSHEMTSDAIQRRVKELLGECGQVLEWLVAPCPGSARIKAYARFATESAALAAVKKLNGSIIDPVSNDKIYVQRIISVKLPVSQRVLAAIRPQLNALAETARSTHYVSIKVYDNPHKLYTQIRVSGSDKTKVAGIKIQVEELLAGDIATDGTLPLTLPFFFQASSLDFFEHTMDKLGVLIVQDRRKMVLRIYGEAVHVEAAQSVLREKALEMEYQAKEVLLNLNTLWAALNGGFQQIATTLGEERVKLDLTSNPKRILVTGSDGDVALVRQMLVSGPSDLSGAFGRLDIDKEDEALCAVCWTRAEDPIKTACGHTYCRSCISAQATSTSEFPLRCLGYAGACATALTLKELEQFLSSATYDALFETALSKHIRTHPAEFQYCSTPDCDRFYRVSTATDPTSVVIFSCDRCLASLCTLCHSAAHSGTTCAASGAVGDGTDELAEWKRNNDVRDCPECGTTIQKRDGCNHMECLSCLVHFCWTCLATFERDDDVYKHMAEVHNDWGGQEPPRVVMGLEDAGDDHVLPAMWNEIARYLDG